jgi:hypothetical protein
MTIRKIYKCNLCKKESEMTMFGGLLHSDIIVGTSVYSSTHIDVEHTCKSCLDILTREVKGKFEDVISKLRQDLMG